ncbi:TonB-dependent receptor [Algoriphagus halophytocola]|uniref:TonB-dependent receptor n=1 Tax=Algoriphagus halophytocola TaxID=2991499 RepID=A0ABY6MJE0_9BACT|nr:MULTISPECIES: TonB-dependent receptor [unclassified Algoriphagus]UZD23901.1 TonB-dependent receptor [Algoriphagus sp. TR-M5]WBL41263.1 TonB-dependent receptor [Algoriphagus sp. TR-M9]
MQKLLLLIVMSIKLLARGLAMLCITVSPLFANSSKAQIKGIDEVVVNLEGQPKSLLQFFRAIEKNSDFKFFYTEQALKSAGEIEFLQSGSTVEQHLYKVAEQSNLRFKQVNNSISVMIQQSDEDQLISKELDFQKISGTVRDEMGEPMPGVSILVKGTTTGTVTDLDGGFTLDVEEGQVLQFSFIGYEKQEQIVGSASEINVTMLQAANSLDEVVVVGYGQQRKANLTGAVDQVDSEAFENRPISNVSQGLVGVIPNLNIKMLDGKPTQSPSYNVRGTTSIGQQGSALVLIDGVEGDPKLLNPNDIASVTVLKDAASASIYGARAAFGVVLITTKEATQGKTSITYTANFSSKSPTTIPDNITESYPWAKGFNDAWSAWNDNGRTPTSINKTMSFSPAYLEEIKRRWEDPSLPRVEVDPSTGEYQYYYSTDWYRELYKEQFFAQDHNLTLTGGDKKASYYVSGRYNGQDGLFRYNTDTYAMYNLRAKGTIQLTPWLQIDNNTDYSRMSYHQPLNVGEGSGIWRNMADEGHPLAPLLNPDGTLSFPAAYTVGDYYIGRNAVDNVQRFLKNRFAAKAELFEKQLTLNANFTFQSTDNRAFQKRVQVPYSRYEGVTGHTGTNTNDLQDRRNTTNYYATNLYANYLKTFNNAHNLGLLAGFNYESSKYENLTTRRNGIVFPDAEDLNLALGQSIVTNGGYQKWAIAGGFFRVNYDYLGRYLVEINGRYDGSSKFPTEQQWAFFPSASVGWAVSEEQFWKVNPNLLTSLKIRASYGSLGNGNIRPYSFTENFSIYQMGRVINGQRPQATSMPGVVPQGLTWETSTTGDIGLDFATLGNRLQFTGDWYRRWTTDMFTVGPTLPAIYGTTVPKGNYADLETTGWEATVTWNDEFIMGDKPFKYNVRLALSDYKAYVTKYNNPDKNLTDYYEGQRIGEIWGYQVEGLFRTDEEILNSPSQSNIRNTNTRKNYVGDLKFKNLDGDDVIYHGSNRVGDSGDKSIIGNSEPRYTYGVNLNAEWNGFFIGAFFQGVLKQDWYPSGESRFWGQYNRPYNQYPSWHEDNMFREELGNFDAYLPRLVGYVALGSDRALSTPNDRFIQNVAYIRLRNIQVGYTFPEHLTSKIHANNVKVYLSAENLWTWSSLYKRTKDTDVTSIYGSDRDLSGGTSGDGYNYPMLKAISAGLTVNF